MTVLKRVPCRNKSCANVWTVDQVRLNWEATPDVAPLIQALVILADGWVLEYRPNGDVFAECPECCRRKLGAMTGAVFSPKPRG